MIQEAQKVHTVTMVGSVNVAKFKRMLNYGLVVGTGYMSEYYKGEKMAATKPATKPESKSKSKSTWLKGAKYKREIYKGGDGMFYVRVKARNGNIVNTMAEGYQRKGKAEGEFDKLYSVDEIQEALNLVDLVVVNMKAGTSEYALTCAYNAVQILNRIQNKIDRRKES